MQKKIFARIFLIMFCLICIYSYEGKVEASPKVIVEQYDYQEDYISIAYPHFSGMENQASQDKMNSYIENIVNTFIAHEESERDFAANREGIDRLHDFNHGKMMYELHYNDGDLVSLALYTDVVFGGSHGRQNLSCYTFDLKTGNIIPFNSMFKWDSQSRQVIYNKIMKQASERERLPKYMNTKDLARKIQNPNFVPNYYLVDKGKSVIVFQPYEIAAYAAGILRFEM